MELLLFQTDIKSKKKVQSLQPLLNNHQEIITWSVDYEDIDNVLRIEATANLSEEDVKHLIRVQGFQIKTLPD